MVFDFYQTKTYKEIAEQSCVNKECTYEQVWKELVLDKTYTAKDRVVVFRNGDTISDQNTEISN